MHHTRSAAKRALIGLLAVGTLLLPACSSTDLVADCCYEGDVVLVYLEDVEFVAANGKVSSFAEVYPGFQAQDSFATKSFPFRKVDISQVTYDALVLPLNLYDANKNEFLEEPEVAVLYLTEGARGMGHEVDHLAVGGRRVVAVTTSRSNVGGLMLYLDARMESLSPEAQAIFRDMERVGLDLIQRGSEGGDKQDKKITP